MGSILPFKGKKPSQVHYQPEGNGQVHTGSGVQLAGSSEGKERGSPSHTTQQDTQQNTFCGRVSRSQKNWHLGLDEVLVVGDLSYVLRDI